jgi:ribosomal protein L11 methyltransferase
MSRSRAADEFWALRIPLGAGPDAAADEAVTNFLWESGAVGVVEEGDDRARGLRAFFPPGSDPAALSRALGEYLDALRQLEVGLVAGPVELIRVPTEAWADAWRAHFRPVPVGRRLLVCPPWETGGGEVGGGDRLAIVIEPGRAFGTGGHASTRGCLELLERLLSRRPGAGVVDVGTGSGILAIAAVRLGAADVRALDVDPDAVAATRANAERNGVAGHVRVELAGFEDWAGPPGELVLANLLGATHVAHAGSLARCVASRGFLVAGGLLVHEAPAVASAFVPEGFALAELVEHEGWAALGLERGA